MARINFASAAPNAVITIQLEASLDEGGFAFVGALDGAGARAQRTVRAFLPKKCLTPKSV
jgi:hypothetical protein